jgi:molybdenum cofactor biosynthesis enzyme MoaA
LQQEIKFNKSSKDKLLNYVLANIKTIKHIYMAGGEPLLMKENELVISALKEHNPTCHVLVNTNLTQVTSSKIFTNLLELQNVKWLISVESMRDQFEYIRYPAKWNDFAENLTYLRAQNTIHEISFHMVLTALNGLEFWNTVDWLIAQGFDLQKMIATLYNNGVYPGPLDVRNLPTEHQQQILDRMCSNPAYKKIAGWQNVYDYLSANQTIDTKLWNYLADLDKRRNLNSQIVFSEVYKYKDTQ